MVKFRSVMATLAMIASTSSAMADGQWSLMTDPSVWTLDGWRNNNSLNSMRVYTIQKVGKDQMTRDLEALGNMYRGKRHHRR